MTPPSTLPEDTPTSSSSAESTSSENEQIDSLETLDLSSGFLLRYTGRKTKRVKAMRMLLSGRLRVLRVDSDFIAAECRGDSGEVYNLGWRDQRWTCSCPARIDCSHLNALWAVVAVSRR